VSVLPLDQVPLEMTHRRIEREVIYTEVTCQARDKVRGSAEAKVKQRNPKLYHCDGLNRKKMDTPRFERGSLASVAVSAAEH
jgi:hypothetical protein